MQENVIVAIFNVPSEAYQAFSELKAHTQTVDSLIAQAVLVKKENGLLIPAESTDFTADSTEGAWTGGLIGAWLGMLGGPVGVLLGGSFGALIGSDAGAAQTVGEACLLENAAQKLDDGSTALVILAQEADEAALDQFFARFRTVVLRRDAAAVQQEVLAAAERREKVEAFKAELKEKFATLAAKLKKKG